MFAIRIRLALLGLVLLVAAGCKGVEGTWVFCGPQPAEMSRHYEFAKVTFNPDSSFHAEGRIDGKPVRVNGTYEYCSGCCKRLTLTIRDQELVYKAVVECGQKLHWTKKLDEERAMTVTFLRHYRCPDCSTCGPCDMKYRKYRLSPDYKPRAARAFREEVSTRQATAARPASTAELACSCGGS